MRRILILLLIIGTTPLVVSQSIPKQVKLPAYQNLMDSGEFFSELEYYLQNEFVVVDSSITDNEIEGESYHRLELYHLAGGHEFSREYFWESGKSTITFKRVSKKEVMKLLMDIFAVTSSISEEEEINFLSDDVHQLVSEDPNYFFSLEVNGKDVILSYEFD